jgi:ABC-type phosphate transport system auxiliary subunit
VSKEKAIQKELRSRLRAVNDELNQFRFEKNKQEDLMKDLQVNNDDLLSFFFFIFFYFRYLYLYLCDINKQNK